MILGVAKLAQGFPAFSLEVDRRGVEEHELEIGEEVAAVDEQIFLDPVLYATRSERRFIFLLVLGQYLAQPTHGTVEMVQLKRITPLDLVRLLPFFGRPIAARDEKTMEY